MEQRSSVAAGKPHLVGRARLGKDPVQSNFHRFMEALIWMRRHRHALRSDGLSVLHSSNANGVIAFHRVPGIGQDVVVVASLNNAVLRNYELAWPMNGRWNEVLNTDAFDDYEATGNFGAWPAPRDGFPATARLTIPPNGVVVFERTG